MKVLKIRIVFVLALVTFTSCNEAKKETSENVTEVAVEVVEEVIEVVETPNIVGVAVGNEAFSTLVVAVKAL